MDDPARHLQHVLADQTYPAARWELVASADAYGVDAATRARLLALPVARYLSFAGVVAALHRAARLPGALRTS